MSLRGGDYTVRIVVEAVDRASREVRKVEGAVRRLSGAVERDSGRISSALSKLGGVLREALGYFLVDAVYRVVEAVQAFAAESVEAFAEFERSVVRLAALAAEPGEGLEELSTTLRAAALAASREFSVGVNDAVSALDALVKAGLSGKEAADALGAALVMARIEGTEFSEAANNLVQVMAQFGLRGSEAMRVVDALVNASRLGIGTANDFAQGLANVGATAKAMGLSLEETLALLVILERRLGSAEEAGTILNRMLLDLGELAEKLGVPLRGLNGELRSAMEVMEDVVAASRFLAPEWDALRETLTGVDVRAIRALTTFMEMRESFELMAESVRRSGAAMEAYNAVMDTAAGRMEKLQARVERLKVGLGEKLAPAWLELQEVALTAMTLLTNSFSSAAAVIQADSVEMRRTLLENLLLMEKITEEEAEVIIESWVRVGDITREQALQMAASLGIPLPELQSLSSEALATSSSIQGLTSSMEEASEAASTMSSTVSAAPTAFTSLVNALAGGRISLEEFTSRLGDINSTMASTITSIIQASTSLQTLQTQLSGLRAELTGLNTAMMENQLAIMELQHAAQARADAVAVELLQLRQQLDLLQRANQAISTAILLMREEVQAKGESAEFTQQEISLLQQLASFIQLGARGRELDLQALQQLILTLAQKNILTQEEAQLLLQLLPQLQAEEAQRHLNIAALQQEIQARLKLGQLTVEETEALIELRNKQRELQEEALRLRIRESELQAQIERTKKSIDSMAASLRESASAANLAGEAVEKLISMLKRLDGMTVHYTIVEHRKVVREETEAGGGEAEGAMQRGWRVWRTGLYLLHRGEYVLPAHVVRHLRRLNAAPSSSTNITLILNISRLRVSEERDVERLAEELSRAVARRLRTP